MARVKKGGRKKGGRRKSKKGGSAKAKIAQVIKTLHAVKKQCT
jgi:hypothetical protein